MKCYRLKKEAVQYFKEDIATSVLPIGCWNERQVDPSALEEVESCYIEYGEKEEGESGRNLAGWSKDGAYFHFTITFPSCKNRDYDKFNKGRTVRELMDNMQRVVNNTYRDFLNDEVE